jgi:hypothetical protein
VILTQPLSHPPSGTARLQQDRDTFGLMGKDAQDHTARDQPGHRQQVAGQKPTWNFSPIGLLPQGPGTSSRFPQESRDPCWHGGRCSQGEGGHQEGMPGSWTTLGRRTLMGWSRTAAVIPRD